MKVGKETILEIKPYKPGEGNIFDDSKAKLSANENPLGCSEKAKDAYIKAANYLNRYPEGGSTDLRQAIAENLAISANNIVCGAGSDEIINLLISAFTEAGDDIIYTEHGFLMYRLYALSQGVNPVAAKEVNLKADIKNIIDLVTDKTRFVFIANPNNPTGSYLTKSELIELREALADEVILVIDGAYAEYVEVEDYESGFDLVRQYKNVVATRTFSKIYGLASLRIGYCYASLEICDILNRVRGPFNVNLPAQLTAVAAIKDQEFVTNSRDFNNIWLEKFARKLEELAIKFYPTVANFILIELPEGYAKKLDDYLKENGIVIRNVAAYKLPNCLRISVGTEAENNRLLGLLEKFVEDENIS